MLSFIPQQHHKRRRPYTKWRTQEPRLIELLDCGRYTVREIAAILTAEFPAMPRTFAQVQVKIWRMRQKEKARAS